MASEKVTAKEAYELIRDEGYTYVDVRSPEEYEASHPVGAINLPFLFFTPAGPQPNPAFVETFKKVAPPGAKVVLGCAGGRRSARAKAALEEAGWEDLRECGAGFDGARDASGAVVETGWSAAGLPCESGQPEGRSWESLKDR